MDCVRTDRDSMRVVRLERGEDVPEVIEHLAVEEREIRGCIDWLGGV